MTIGDERPLEVRVAIPEMDESFFLGEKGKRSEPTLEKDSMVIGDGSAGEVRVEMTETETEGSEFIEVEREKLKSALADERAKWEKDLSQAKNPFLIYRVPPVLRERKKEFKKTFEPRVVAIGPFHHRNPELQGAEETKSLFAAHFAEENDTSEDDLHRNILAEMKDLRECYDPEDIKSYSNMKLSWMFMVDGCAVLYAMCDYVDPFTRYGEKVSPFFYVDLLLLENQLPYRVLQILIDSTTERNKWEDAIDYFIYQMAPTNVVSRGDEKHSHILAKFHSRLHGGGGGGGGRGGSNFICRVLWRIGCVGGDGKTVAGAKSLQDSGISFRSNVLNWNDNLRNISFHRKFPAVLRMPILQVDDSTDYLFMNLIALESCPNFYGTTVRSYLGFMAYLIQTPEDVKVLQVSGMLKNYSLKNDEDVALLFRHMGNDQIIDPEIRFCVIKNINRYCSSWLVNYFGAHWSFVTFVGALGGLAMTLVQTYFQVNKYLKQDTKTD